MAISREMNIRLVEKYKTENGLTCELHTFSGWRKLGYRVKKHEPSHHGIKQFTPKGYIILWFWDETQVEKF